MFIFRPESESEPLVLSPTGIASAEAFGTPTLSRLIIAPTGIASAEAFGTPTLSRLILSPTSIASAEAFGTATVTRFSAMYATAVGAYAETQGNPLMRATHVGAYVEYGRPPRVRVTAVGAYVEAEAIPVVAASFSGTPAQSNTPRFVVGIFERDFSLGGVPLRMDNVRFVVERYSHAAVGGPDMATVKAYGDYRALWGMVNRLRCPVIIYNHHLTPVWWGYIAAVDVAAGSVSVGVDLDTMYNRVAVTYNATNAEGGETTTTEATTAWVEDATSTAAYGYRELVHQAETEMSSTTADAFAATLLAKYKVPTPVIKFGQPAEHCVTLTCRGWWQALSWRMLYNYEGQEIYEDNGAGEQFVGWGVTSAKIGFTMTDKRIMDVDGEIDDLVKGQRIKVTGSTSNNNAYTLNQGTDIQRKQWASTTISFDAGTDEIRDSANKMTTMNAPGLVEVAGSTSNDGVYEIVSGSIDGSKVKVTPGLSDEAAGDSVTLTRGQHITVVEAVVDEAPGDTVTLTAYGQKTAQKFTLANNVTWDVSGLQVRAKKKRSPADNLKIALWSDSGGSPNAELQSGTIAGANVGEDSDWRAVTLGAEQTIAYGTDYWVVVSRTGADDHEGYYIIDINQDATYTQGALKVYDGAAWQDPATAADMPFRVTGTLPTTEQIDDDVMVYGQFVTDVVLTDTSTLETCQYRDGSRNLQDEVEELLQIGNASAKRMLARINVDRKLEVYAEPAQDSDDYFIDSDGVVRQWTDQPLEPGVAPVAIWANLRDVAEMTANLDAVADPSCFFIERAEYDAQSGAWTLEPHEEDGSAWDLRWITRLSAKG